MTYYQIAGRTDGHDYGIFQADTPQDALAAMAADAGHEASEIEAEAWIVSEVDLQPAIDRLGAVRLNDDFAYCAEETGEWYLISASEMRDLAELLTDPECDDPYSEWCATAGDLLGDDAAARAAGIID